MEFTLFCRNICFAAIYAVLSQNLFCCGLRTFCVETNYGQNVVNEDKITNIMYALSLDGQGGQKFGQVWKKNYLLHPPRYFVFV